uniref:Uncharacterized protein n=1 Tax=Variovorax paradoxus (strain S110) TaxID=543728 RepID=C5CUY0_VARPS
MKYNALPDNIFSFMAAEDENAHVSTYKNVQHLHALEKVDSIVRSPVPKLHVPKEMSSVARLYLFIHYQLYSTFANLMRLHLAEAMAAQRKAIDAALSAYKIVDDPATVNNYENREWEFQNIKTHIVKVRKGDPAKYPLADELIKTHEVASEYGAHADVSTFVLRTANEPIEGSADQMRQLFLYFQAPESEAQCNLMYVDALSNFLTITRIFDPFFKQYTKDWDVEGWINHRDAHDGWIRKELGRVHGELEKEFNAEKGKSA